MKVLCSACEGAEARVLCCADEAALCARCDREVHAANRLASKHQRLPILSPASSASAAAATSPAKCDICQECHAYFFCLEDRALLCRSCDVAVHTANAFVSAHRRFLLTGVQVGQELGDQPPEPPEPPPPPPPAKSTPAPLFGEGNFSWAAGPPAPCSVAADLAGWPAVNEQFGSPAEPTSKLPPKRSPRGTVTAAAFGGQGGMAGGTLDWPLDEIFGGFGGFNNGFGFGESGTSKADSAKLGSTEGSLNYQSSSEDKNSDELFGQVPEIQWSVPELPSPPTASGLYWQRGSHHGSSDSTAFVPDVCSPENHLRCFAANQESAKRRRRC